MNRAQQLAAHIAELPPTSIDGNFFRHSSPRWSALNGSDGGGRWGKRGAFSVLYLGRPLDSVIVEAYRHLVDDVEGMRADLVQPRRLVTCRITVANLLDLRVEAHRERVGLTLEDLCSPPGDYERCQRVAAAAHQLRLHGIIAPAATQRGETLALFEDRLPAVEKPMLVGPGVLWDGLPPDPRQVGSR